jgi:hypothetical protein
MADISAFISTTLLCYSRKKGRQANSSLRLFSLWGKNKSLLTQEKAKTSKRLQCLRVIVIRWRCIDLFET